MTRPEDMTTAELEAECADRQAWIDSLTDDDELGGGSPLEGFYERWDDLEAELKKRKV